MVAVDETVRQLEERVGQLYDLEALAQYFHMGRRELRRALERAGVPVIEVGRKRLVQRELAEKALGLDYAELLLEIHRQHEWMARREVGADGQRKPVAEYAEETTSLAQQALAEAEQR